MASAWDIIGKASATQRGTPFAPGTQGEATVTALREFTSNNGEGLILVLEADIVSSVAKGDEYLVDIVANKTAKTIVQKPGTRVSSVFMLTKHKAAPGAAKAMLLSILGENESTLTPEAWSEPRSARQGRRRQGAQGHQVRVRHLRAQDEGRQNDFPRALLAHRADRRGDHQGRERRLSFRPRGPGDTGRSSCGVEEGLLDGLISRTCRFRSGPRN